MLELRPRTVEALIRGVNSLHETRAVWHGDGMEVDDYAVRLIDRDALDRFVTHLGLHDAESGTHGDLPNGPYSRHVTRDPADVRARALLRWDTPLDELGWRRDWGLFLGDRIVGSVHLSGAEIEASLHRVGLGVGIERPHRGRGQGERLVRAAIAWARAEPTIDWIDLGVFEGNTRALALYERLGFVECGRKRDLFRVDGLSISDIQMTLDVSRSTQKNA